MPEPLSNVGSDSTQKGRLRNTIRYGTKQETPEAVRSLKLSNLSHSYQVLTKKNAVKVKNCTRSFLYIYGEKHRKRQKEEQRKVPTDYLNVCENCLSLDLMRHFLVSWLTSSAERPVRSSSEGARLTLSDCLNYYLERGWHIPNRPCIRQ